MIVLHIILIVTIVTSIIAFQNSQVFYKLSFIPYRIVKFNEFFRFFSYGFIHADFVHLIINMYVLYSFGVVLNHFAEYIFISGELFFASLYLSSLFVSTTVSFFRQKNNYNYLAVGASGSVSAVVFACILIYPADIRILFIPIDIPAWLFAIAYVIYSAIMSQKKNSNIGHDVHLIGSLYGFMFPLFFKPQLLIYFFLQIIG